jgi:hypothetical protein
MVRSGSDFMENSLAEIRTASLGKVKWKLRPARQEGAWVCWKRGPE